MLLEARPHDSSYPKSGVSFFVVRKVFNQSFMLRMKFIGKNPAIRVTAKSFV
jgi:hypothetical protein